LLNARRGWIDRLLERSCADPDDLSEWEELASRYEKATYNLNWGAVDFGQLLNVSRFLRSVPSRCRTLRCVRDLTEEFRPACGSA
jgi:hypothetical protein